MLSYIKEKRRNLFPSALLTLVSVIQASVFGFFIYMLTDRMPFIKLLDIIELITFLVTVAVMIFLLIVTWNEYMMLSTTLVWIPGFTDTATSFLSGIVQAITIYYCFEKTATWYFVFSAFPTIIFVVYYNAYSKSAKHDENGVATETLNARTKFGCNSKVITYCFLLIMFILLLSMGIITAMLPYYSVLHLIFRLVVMFMGVAFAVKSHFQWKKIVNKVCANK